MFHSPGGRCDLYSPRAYAALKGGPAEIDVKAGECQVCNSALTGAVVLCARCRTPHHEACWTYAGRCSTYGCREIRFTR